MNDCLFCKIVAGSIPSRKIYEDDQFFAFLDIFPASRGHTLVIPKSHHQDIEAIPESLYGDLGIRVKRVADILSERLSTDGVTIFQMNKSAGWQSVFHIHFHVVPRWAGDTLNKPWELAPAVDSELADLQQIIGIHKG